MDPFARRPPPGPARSPARTTLWRAALAAVAGLVLVLLPVPPVGASPPPAAGSAARTAGTGTPFVRVSGNHLVDAAGTTIRLVGVDHTGSESACMDGEGFFDPPNSDTPAMIATIRSWDVDAVRVPLNEDCWLGINLPFPQLGGSAYRAAITSYVDDLNAAGLAVILDLHWSAPARRRPSAVR